MPSFRVILWVIAAALVGLIAAAPAGAAGPQDAIHEVMAGDNLHLIAGYYYGDPRQWKRVWKTNRKALAGPSRLAPGKTLRIEDFVDDNLLGSYDDYRSRVLGK